MEGFNAENVIIDRKELWRNKKEIIFYLFYVLNVNQILLQH